VAHRQAGALVVADATTPLSIPPVGVVTPRSSYLVPYLPAEKAAGGREHQVVAVVGLADGLALSSVLVSTWGVKCECAIRYSEPCNIARGDVG
jgi:hypothetical protein